MMSDDEGVVICLSGDIVSWRCFGFGVQHRSWMG